MNQTNFITVCTIKIRINGINESGSNQIKLNKKIFIDTQPYLKLKTLIKVKNFIWGIEFNENPTSEANQMRSNQIKSITYELK